MITVIILKMITVLQTFTTRFHRFPRKHETFGTKAWNKIRHRL